MATDLVSRARAGDAEAFRALTEPHRRELQAHCYRMLGSFQDAEDALQETLVSAWRGLAGFKSKASLRTWLYSIATNQCLNAIRAGKRRPVKAWDIPGLLPPEPSSLGGVPWLGPIPDSILEQAIGIPVGPEARFEQNESISLAFVSALQVIPPRQLAVLVLRDVMGFRAAEVADMLGTTVPSVNSSLGRARSRLELHRMRRQPSGAAPDRDSQLEKSITARFVAAYESADVAALVELFTDDVFISMPPIPLQYEGRDSSARFFSMLLHSDRRYSLVPTRANGAPAFGSYVSKSDGRRHASGLFVIELDGVRIASLTRFENKELVWFGLPQSLESTEARGISHLDI